MTDLNQLLQEITQKIETIHFILGGGGKHNAKKILNAGASHLIPIITTQTLFETNPFQNITNTANHLNSGDWFINAFNFCEENYDYDKNQNIFKKLFREGNYKTIKGMSVGNFNLPTLNNFYYLKKNHKKNHKKNKVTLTNIYESIIDLHETCEKYSTFQVASQLNCLEMINPIKLPENGITCYKEDGSQGPRCVMQTPAAIAYRNYLYPQNGIYGQKDKNQINMADDLLDWLCEKNNDIKTHYLYQNGYLFITQNGLCRINAILKDNTNYMIAQSKLKIGNHTDISTTTNKIINHVLCSGLPIGYHEKQNIDTYSIPQKYISGPKTIWESLSKLFLETYYINTLLIAYENNMKNKCNAPCYLTLVGGGFFKMDIQLIKESIIKACEYIKEHGLTLNIYLVIYTGDNEILKLFPKDLIITFS